jgi:hypothetical protein
MENLSRPEYGSDTMRGKKTTDEKKEEVRAVIYLNPEASHKDIAKTVNLPESTVRGIKEELKLTDEFNEVRTKKKEEFITEAWDIVKKIMLKVDVKLDTMDAEALQKVNIRDLAVALGTIYDKQALASGEPTIISDRPEPTPELLQELEEKVARLKQLTGS